MVAQTPEVTAFKRPRKLVPFRLPESTRLAVRSLYVVHGMQPARIAESVNLTPEQVRNLIHREKWSALRTKGEKTRKDKLAAEIDARATEDVQRVVESTAILAEDLQMRSLGLCAEYLDQKDAKSLQMASGAARNFVQISRLSRRLDAQPGGNQPGNSGPQTTVIFVGALERAQPKELKQAEPAAIEISAKTPELT